MSFIQISFTVCDVEGKLNFLYILNQIITSQAKKNNDQWITNNEYRITNITITINKIKIKKKKQKEEMQN